MQKQHRRADRREAPLASKRAEQEPTTNFNAKLEQKIRDEQALQEQIRQDFLSWREQLVTMATKQIPALMKAKQSESAKVQALLGGLIE